jgi:hypothetical protein
MKRWAWRFAAALFGLWVMAALYSLRPVSHDSEPVTYVLGWEWGDAERLADGTWSVTSDLGHEVVVVEGYVVSYEATVIACSEESSWTESLLEALVPIPASAGHSESAGETVVAEVVESLSDPQTSSIGPGETTRSDYCESHLAFGTAEPADTTLHLELVVDGTPVVVSTPLAWGTLGQIEQVGGDGDIEVVILRDLSTMFDGIDFDGVEPDEIAESLLRSLSASTTFSAT